MDITALTFSQSGNKATLSTDSGYFELTRADLLRFISDTCGTQSISEFSDNLPIFIPDSISELLLQYDEKLKAIEYASYILGISDKTEKQLFSKLRLKGYSQAACDEALAVLKKNGYIDDKRYCKRKCETLAMSKLYGKHRIISELAAKGISRRLCEEVIEDCEIDFDQNLCELFQKLTKGEYPQSREQAKKLSDKLARYGYGYEQISDIFSRFCEY